MRKLSALIIIIIVSSLIFVSVKADYLIPNVPYISQGTKPYCANACETMVLNYYGCNVTLDEVVNKTFNTASQSTYPTNMKSYAISLNFSAISYSSSTINDVRVLIDQNKPVIIFQRSGSAPTDYTRYHCTLAVGYTDSLIILNDPGRYEHYNLTYYQFILR
jgi:ABC-type bacteriocin/lantibiotic exporter with double-glycine peptidase domain